MKRYLISPLFSVALLLSPLAAFAGTNVGVAVSVGQPGFYGQIDVGGVPPPPVIYAQPMVIQPLPPGVVYPPLYLHVPPGHYRNWRYYCGRYNACGRPVYFVNDGWYRHTYVPYYRHQHNRHYYNDNGRR
jgi:hypothetical protein